jgi:hypothetical protein
MSTLTPDMWAEIKQILRTSSPASRTAKSFATWSGSERLQIASIRDTTNVYYVKDPS